MKFQEEIANFLATKPLSKNSRASYSYDLQQFARFFDERELTEASLMVFRKSLSELTVAAQKRKISAINQFLLYLYEAKILPDYFRLKKVEGLSGEESLPTYLDLSAYYGPIKSPGHFIMLLILETGLTPAEIQQLQWSDFDWRFNILTIKFGLKRVIRLNSKFAIRVKTIKNADELFAKSRQALHLELKKFTHYTARELRIQFILRQRREGKTIYEVAQTLGLKSTMTLEKYFKP